MATLPFEGANYHTGAGEAMRVRVNDWIRTSGTFDAVVDMEKFVADPANPKRLDPALQRGDNLHPDGRGQTRIGEAIPLDIIECSEEGRQPRRSGERRVGKECVSTCRSRWSPNHKKKK